MIQKSGDHHLSNQQKALLLFMYVGDYTIQFCGDNNKPL